jgi:hypothetical protein
LFLFASELSHEVFAKRARVVNYVVRGKRIQKGFSDQRMTRPELSNTDTSMTNVMMEKRYSECACTSEFGKAPMCEPAPASIAPSTEAKKVAN